MIHPVYRTSRGLTEEMKELLSRQGNVILATINDDGTPHLTELLFLLDSQDRVQMPTPHNTRKYRNLQKRPVATAFFYDQQGWISTTGSVELWTGKQSERANQANRHRLLTAAGHDTIGRFLADQEDTTIVLTPQRWLSFADDYDNLLPEIERLGGDVDTHPPESWFRDLKG